MAAASENLELLKIALKTASLAEENILKFYQSDMGVEWKKDNTPVTIADKGTEELARQFWAKETPGFGVVGEEFGIESPDAEYQWVIDPIDGTKSFIHGVPLFGTLIALYKKCAFGEHYPLARLKERGMGCKSGRHFFRYLSG